MNLKIADYFGIPLYVNLLILPFLWFIHATTPDDLGIFAVAIFILTLFFVLLHEYGHCWMARKVGWEVQDITILPIGGVAKINFKHNNPFHEIAVALAGPAVSLALSCLFFGLTAFTLYLENFPLSFVFIVLFTNNTVILLFNMLPLFPMDGGRVFRAILSYGIGYERATWWAVRISQVFAITLSITAFYYSYIITGCLLLYLVSIAQNELAYAKLIGSLHRIRTRVCEVLDKPELKEANVGQIIQALEAVEDVDLKEKLCIEEMLPLLRDLKETNMNV